MYQFKTLAITTLLVSSLQLTYAIDTFDSQADSLLNRFKLQLGEAQELTLDGQSDDSGDECQVRVINSTKISHSFPDSSKSAQQIEVSITEGDRFEKFMLGRSTDVLSYQNQITTGSSLLKISVKNRTGIGRGKMKQAIALQKNSSADRSLNIAVRGFSGETLNCRLSSR